MCPVHGTHRVKPKPTVHFGPEARKALVPAAEDEEGETEEDGALNSGDNDDGSSSDGENESEGTADDSTPAESASAAGDDAADGAAAQSSDDDGRADAKAKAATAARQEEEKEAEEAAKDPRIALITRSQLLRKFLELCPSTLYTADGRRVRTVVGFVGYPNVGKSSTINVLCGQKRVAVAATPGKTKHFQVRHGGRGRRRRGGVWVGAV